MIAGHGEMSYEYLFQHGCFMKSMKPKLFYESISGERLPFHVESKMYMRGQIREGGLLCVEYGLILLPFWQPT